MSSETEHYYTLIPSPHGQILIAKDVLGITHISFQDGEAALVPDESWVNDETPFCEAIRGFFYGDLCEFDLPLNPKGTDFQKQVWECLGTIPCGDTVSYQDIANQMR